MNSIDALVAFLTLLLGWFLGLLTPGIVDAIRRPKERRELATGLRIELGELRQRVALHGWYVRSRHGLHTKENIQWALDAVNSGPTTGHLKAESLDALRHLANSTVEDLTRLNAYNKSKRASLALSVPRIEAPFMTTHLGRLTLFSAETQRQLLLINAQVNLFNEQVEQATEFFKMTFSADSEENFNRIETNATASEERIAVCAETLANAIADLQIR
jgi:hypothetical protein